MGQSFKTGRWRCLTGVEDHLGQAWTQTETTWGGAGQGRIQYKQENTWRRVAEKQGWPGSAGKGETVTGPSLVDTEISISLTSGSAQCLSNANAVFK